MRRRDFIALAGGGAISLPLAARAQQPSMPVIGFLDPRSPDALADRLRGFRQGLKDTGYIEGENIKAYLFSVARRRLADHFRRRARAPAVDFALSSLADLATGPATQLGRHQRRELLREGLARIPLDDQIALELAYFENLSTRELAAVLEIQENTVRSRLSRARDKLRAALAELGSPEEARLADSKLRGSNDQRD